MTPAAVHLAAAAAYAGFQWTVHLVLYPQFALVGPDVAARYAAAHQRRITPLVAVLFAAWGGTALWWLLAPDGRGRWPGVVAGLLLVAVLAVTAFAAVPEHRRLARGWDPQAHRRLLRADAVRVLLASVDLAWALWLVAG
ncbi:DUF1772 domain-containing protein [Nakamurella endophytica]|uniref:DUF1772 domain-containing protein n=1 Tax=Nakamurella endophytica TaxID=1748367 RepID=A0A917WF65_9ACTN|nr:DUF1772 domain-containing protein [Nakamurella endophytica]GGL99202.1 hypothetical protein GCM10011594_18980 [Nakamurella endophytica]